MCPPAPWAQTKTAFATSTSAGISLLPDTCKRLGRGLEVEIPVAGVVPVIVESLPP